MNESLMEGDRGSFSESTLIIVKREAGTNLPSITNVAKKMLKEYKGGRDYCQEGDSHSSADSRRVDVREIDAARQSSGPQVGEAV